MVTPMLSGQEMSIQDGLHGFLHGSGLIAWKFKKQISASTLYTEAEYRAYLDTGCELFMVKTNP